MVKVARCLAVFNGDGKRLIAEGVVDMRMEADEPWPIDELARMYIDTYSGVSYEDTLRCALGVLEYAKNRGVTVGSGASLKSREIAYALS